MKKALLTTSVALLVSLGCVKERESPPEGDGNTLIFAGPVAVEKHELKAGQPDAALIQKGLEASAEALEEIVADARRATPDLHGWFEGTLHIESNGNVRMFAEGESAIEQAGEAKIIDLFVESVFGKKWSFPEIGQDCLLYVKSLLSGYKSNSSNWL